LPDEADLAKLPRQWVINLVNSLVGQPFSSWVGQQIEQRNSVLAAKNDLMIDLDPEIAKAFHTSTSISSKFFQLQGVATLSMAPFELIWLCSFERDWG
jgi:hypothetical protein